MSNLPVHLYIKSCPSWIAYEKYGINHKWLIYRYQQIVRWCTKIFWLFFVCLFFNICEQKMNSYFITNLCLGFFIHVLINKKNKTELCKLITYYNYNLQINTYYELLHRIPCKCVKFIILRVWNLKFSTLLINLIFWN